jgi:hypothetical protein
LSFGPHIDVVLVLLRVMMRMVRVVRVLHLLLLLLLLLLLTMMVRTRMLLSQTRRDAHILIVRVTRLERLIELKRLVGRWDRRSG